MNKRIKELIEQAGIHFGRSAALDGNDIARFVTTSDMEKFAELIVEEVYDYILNATFDDEPWPSRKDVKQHFGVEEK